MNTKLTLRIDRQLIEQAKRYAARRGKSVSKIVGELFAALEKEPPENRFPLTPIVKSMKGAWSGQDVGEDDYKAYLRKKFL